MKPLIENNIAADTAEAISDCHQPRIPTVGDQVSFVRDVYISNHQPDNIATGDTGVLLTTNREGHWGVFVEGKRLIDVEDASVFKVLDNGAVGDLEITKTYRIVDEKVVMDSAKELSRIFGRDHDWEPVDVCEAIQELELIAEGSPESNGYEIISSETRRIGNNH